MVIFSFIYSITSPAIIFFRRLVSTSPLTLTKPLSMADFASPPLATTPSNLRILYSATGSWVISTSRISKWSLRYRLFARFHELISNRSKLSFCLFEVLNDIARFIQPAHCIILHNAKTRNLRLSTTSNQLRPISIIGVYIFALHANTHYLHGKPNLDAKWACSKMIGLQP